MKTFKNFLEKSYKILFPLIAIAVIVIVWQILALVYNAEVIMPSPIKVIGEFFIALSSGDFYFSLLYTLLRAIVAFIISFVLAFITAYISYKNKYFKYFMMPLTLISKTLPTMSIILLCYLVISPSVSPIFITFLVVFPLSYTEQLNNLQSLDINIIQTAKVYGVSDKKIFKNYLLPEMLEKSFFTSVSLLAFSIKLTISAEAIVFSSISLGVLMSTAKSNLQTGLLFAYTIVAILLGLLLEFIAYAVKKRVDNKRGNL